MDRHPYEIDDSFQDNILMPGFIDTHTHFLMSGVFQMLYYVGPITSYGAKGGTNDPCHSRDDVLQRLRNIVAKAGDSQEPIVCWGYDRAEYNGDLDRDMLDEISDTIPISVTCYTSLTTAPCSIRTMHTDLVSGVNMIIDGAMTDRVNY